MTRRSTLSIAALAGLGILAADAVHGQARNANGRESGRRAQVRADPVVAHAAELKRIDSWLRTLAGQYRLTVAGQSLEGLVDCAGIGAGPGTHCIFSIGPPRQRDRWENAVMLFGFDAEAPEVNRFQLNRDSTAEAGTGRLRGDSVTILGQCPTIDHYPPVIARGGVINFSVLFCRREARVHVEPDGKMVRIRQSTVEQVLVRPPGGRGQITEFRALVEWNLERLPTP